MMEAQLVKTESSVELKRVFQAPVDLLYQAWTDAEMMNGWFHPSPKMRSLCEVDLRVGGRYQVKMHSPDGDVYTVGGVYKEIVPREKLVFSWRWQGAPEPWEMLVTILFRSLGTGETELTLRHEQFPNIEERDSHLEGWQGTFEQLAAALT